MAQNRIESSRSRSPQEVAASGFSRERARLQRAQRRRWNVRDIADKWTYGGVTEGDAALVQDALVDYGFYKGLGPKSRVLDAGVGARSYVDRNKLPEGSRLYAVDLSLSMLHTLQQDDPQQHDGFIVADIAQLPIPTDSVDCSVISFPMRYLPLYGQLDAILQFVRVTEDKGEVHLIDYDKLYHPGEKRAFSPKLLEEYLSRPHILRRLDALGKSITVETHTLNDSYDMPFPQRLDYMKIVVSKKSKGASV